MNYRHLLSPSYYTEKGNLRILLLFIGSAILFRCLSFFVTVIDHDESTYLIIARELLRGQSLYVDVIDTKPPGIFWLFASVQYVLGFSILAIRITAAVTVGLTAFILYRSRLLLSPRKDLALFSGLVYVVVISSYRFGLAANTELFFNFFVVGGLYYLLQRQKHT